MASSMTPIRLWSPRLLTNASRLPSGDQSRSPTATRTLASELGSPVPVTGAFMISPRRRKTTTSPLGDTTGSSPGPTRETAPSATVTRHTTCSAPATSLVGLGISPRLLGAPPRTKKMVWPSGVRASEPISCPSSWVYLVSWRPRYSVGCATQTLRTPLALWTHATVPPVGAATRSSGNGALKSRSMVTAPLWPAAGDPRANAVTTRPAMRPT